MEQPQITWFVKNTSDISADYIQDAEFFAGTYTQGNPVSVEFMIWNNRYGTTPVADLKDFGFEISFDDEEDYGLLKYFTFVVNNAEYASPEITGNAAVIKSNQNIVLSGAVNDGTASNTENYMILRLEFDVPEGKKIKMNDLKNLTINIISL